MVSPLRLGPALAGRAEPVSGRLCYVYSFQQYGDEKNAKLGLWLFQLRKHWISLKGKLTSLVAVSPEDGAQSLYHLAEICLTQKISILLHSPGEGSCLQLVLLALHSQP